MCFASTTPLSSLSGCRRLIWLGKEPLSTFALAALFDDAELRNAAAMAATPHFTELKELDELECDPEWKTRLVGRRPVASAILIDAQAES